MQFEDAEVEKVGNWREDISFRKKDEEGPQTKSFSACGDVLIILINVSNIMHQNNIIK